MIKRKTGNYITRAITNNFNQFISTGTSTRITGTFISGGEYDYTDKAYNIFHSPAGRLDSFRDDFFRKFNDNDNIPLSELKKGLSPLLELYEEVARYKQLNKRTRNLLEEQFFEPAKYFFNEIDEIYDTNYFLNKLNEIPINRSIVSDEEFAIKYFGKSKGYGSKLGKEAITEFEEKIKSGESKTKEKVKEFAEETYVDSSAEIEKDINKKISVFLKIEVNGVESNYTFSLKRFESPELLPLGEFTTNGAGRIKIKIYPGEYKLILLDNTQEYEDKEKSFFIENHQEKAEIKFDFNKKTKSPNLIQKIVNFFKKLFKFN